MKIKCDECNKKGENDNHCAQWLGEACGWQWWPRLDDSWKDCHLNSFPDSYYIKTKEKKDV